MERLTTQNRLPTPVNLMYFSKGAELHVFRWEDDSLPALCRTIWKFALDEDFELDWNDAAALIDEARKVSKAHGVDL